MTEKQKRTIGFIENALEIKFHGETDRDTWSFINRNLENAKKCAAFESQMSIQVCSLNLGKDDDNDFCLDRDLSRELLTRDIQKGKTPSECMLNFSGNLITENCDEDLEEEWVDYSR